MPTRCERAAEEARAANRAAEARKVERTETIRLQEVDSGFTFGIRVRSFTVRMEIAYHPFVAIIKSCWLRESTLGITKELLEFNEF